MVLKIYAYRGSTYQFDDSDVPEGAVEVKVEPPVKTRKPANKAHAPSGKSE